MFRFGRKDKDNKDGNIDKPVLRKPEGFIFNADSEVLEDPETLKILSKMTQLNMLEFTLAGVEDHLGTFVFTILMQASVIRGLNMLDMVDQLREENKEEIKEVHECLFRFYEKLSEKYKGDMLKILAVFTLTMCGEYSGFIESIRRKINNDIMGTAEEIAERIENA